MELGTNGGIEKFAFCFWFESIKGGISEVQVKTRNLGMLKLFYILTVINFAAEPNFEEEIGMFGADGVRSTRNY